MDEDKETEQLKELLITGDRSKKPGVGRLLGRVLGWDAEKINRVQDFADGFTVILWVIIVLWALNYSTTLHTCADYVKLECPCMNNISSTIGGIKCDPSLQNGILNFSNCSS